MTPNIIGGLKSTYHYQHNVMGERAAWGKMAAMCGRSTPLDETSSLYIYLCIPPPRAGRMSARVSGANGHEAYLAEAIVVAFQGCAQTVNTHGTHTPTQENILSMRW